MVEDPTQPKVISKLNYNTKEKRKEGDDKHNFCNVGESVPPIAYTLRTKDNINPVLTRL